MSRNPDRAGQPAGLASVADVGETRARLLEIRSVSKAYARRGFAHLFSRREPQRTQALNDVSLDLLAGDVTALLGPNGAGKTTLVNVVCDLVRADSGTVRVGGHAVPARGLAARGHLGYVTTNDRSFFWRLTARRNLEFFAALHGYSPAAARARSAEMLERFGLAANADELFHAYSAGMKKRLGLARAFLHDPSVLLLDEPTNGLDARSADELLAMVREQARSSGKTVLWATHRGEEVERLCDRVIVLIGGRLCFDDSVARFMAIARRRMSFTIHAYAPRPLQRFNALLASFKLRSDPAHDGAEFQVHGEGDEQRLSGILSELLAQGALVGQIDRHSEPLYRVFEHIEHAEKHTCPVRSAVR